ncbi:MAG: NADP oxidoreductase [Anaerolineae bacterium]|nr:NADP oxidoreductase [Anaerolineae bacterium]MDW8171839.1 NADP oxidoreductase [Anaerolineae bacterium]
MSKAKVATIWLDGCSGCHMSFLDMDERLLELAEVMDLVYSPLVDFKDFPEAVDVTLVEGAVSSEEDREKIIKVRARTRLLVALGDCAVAGNVPAMRNAFKVKEVIGRAYLEDDLTHPQAPHIHVPPLLVKVKPVHQVVKVDLVIPGCPPSANIIHYAVTELLAGRTPDLSNLTRFGA